MTERLTNQYTDLIVVGAGIMGLFTAYYSTLANVRNITIVERYKLGNERRAENDPKAASYSLTRSFRSDYLDPYYSRLANEARGHWKDFESRTGKRLLIDSGCLNIAKLSVSPDLTETYATRSFQTMSSLSLAARMLSKSSLEREYPQFEADVGCLDVEAGFLFLPEITRSLLRLLRERGVGFLEDTRIAGIARVNDGLSVTTDRGTFISSRMVVTAGLWTNDVLGRIQGCDTRFPLTAERPRQCKYYIPSADKRVLFQSDRLPVFAYLDVGVYGHPIYGERTPGVKIGLYNPPAARMKSARIADIDGFVRECMPSLRDAAVIHVIDADQCAYDMVPDGDFILGNVPGFTEIAVGAGWCGTGFKFAPLVGTILSQLAIRGGTVYNIKRFSPDRFQPTNAPPAAHGE